VPVLDAFTIGTLFTLRLMLGVAAARLAWSAWLLTFSMFFFFSLTMAKRHTELLRMGETAPGDQGVAHGRGYASSDKDITFAFGVCAAMASILILALYLIDEVFPAALYSLPGFLWLGPAAVFLWVSRIWVLAHRGRMNDDPVVFALTDKVSLALGVVVAAGFVLALL
jgi:4-hydroxybenzoate polyprenyltransferase